MVDGGMKCVKYILFAFNLVFFLAGLGLIITGAVVQTNMSEYLSFFDDSSVGVAVLLIVVGSVIFVIGFFGCCGAYKENYCMTMTFAALLGIVFVLEIAGGITAYVMKDQVRDVVAEKMNDAMKNYGKTESQGVTDTWNTLQSDFKCCGVNNYTDWDGSGANLQPNAVPDSCCKDNTMDCGNNQLPVADNTIYQKGCLIGFTDNVESNIVTVGGVGIGLAFVQIFGILLACCLARSIKKEYEVV